MAVLFCDIDHGANAAQEKNDQTVIKQDFQKEKEDKQNG